MNTTVFVDKIAPNVANLVRSCAKRHFGGMRIIPCDRGLVAAWHETGRHERESTVGNFTCFVTDKKTLADADMAYAIFGARIPAFTLAPCETLSPLMWAPPAPVNEDAGIEAALDDFFNFPEKRGKVLVMEGGDGAGKETQTKVLVEHLRRDGATVKTLDFPHDAAPYGELVRVVLSGKKGGISELDPHLFSFIYSLNRYGCLPELGYWMRRGYVAALDRYYTANFGHQASKLPVDKRKGFVAYLEHGEVDWLGLPRADQVFYIDLPSKVALEAMRTDTTRAYLDIHETAGGDYKENVRQTFLWCCAELKDWKRVRCCDDDATRRSREELHEEIYTQAAAVLQQ